MVRVAFAALLLAHGLIHASFVAPAPATADGPPWPFHLDRSWLLRRLGLARESMLILGRAITLGTVIGFAVAAVAVLLGVSWWLPVTLVAAALSLLQLVVWFHWWLPVGVAIDVALLAVVGTSTWTPIS